MPGGFPLAKWWTFQVVLTDRSLSAKARLVYARLLKYHNQKTGQCNPSEERLGLDLGYSDRSIRTALRELDDIEYIDIRRGGGRRISNQYYPILIGGKNEYLNAEKLRFETRKAASAEKKKEKKKEQNAKAESMPPQPVRTKPAARDVSEAEKMLESAFLAMFPDRQEGHAQLVKAPSGTWNELVEELADGVTDIHGAVERLINALS